MARKIVRQATLVASRFPNLTEITFLGCDDTAERSRKHTGLGMGRIPLKPGQDMSSGYGCTVALKRTRARAQVCVCVCVFVLRVRVAEFCCIDR